MGEGSATKEGRRYITSDEMTSDERSVRLAGPRGENLDPAEVAFVDSIEIRALDGDRSEMTLRVRAQERKPGLPWPRHDDSFMPIELRLQGVSDVSLNHVDGLPFQIVGFDIVDVSGRGLEGIAFEVLDFERGLLHVFAEAVEAAEGWRVL